MCVTRQKHLYPCRWVNAPAYKLCYICGCLDVCHCVIEFALRVFLIRSASFFRPRVCYVCVCVTPTMSYQLVRFLSAPRQVWYNGGRNMPPLWAFQTGELLLPHPSFSRTPSSIKQVLPFTSDLIRPMTFALHGWTPDENLLHLVLCCRLHLPTGMAPTHACLCPSPIHSDFVQLVNLASPPCWELRQRKREGECVRRRRWRRRSVGGGSAEEWRGNQKFV